MVMFLVLPPMESISFNSFVLLEHRIILLTSTLVINCYLDLPYLLSVVLFVCFVALRPKSTAMVMAGRSVHLTTLFGGQA